MSASPATRTAPQEVMQIIIDLHAAVDARVKVCPVLMLAADIIFRALGSLRDGLAALVGRIPGGASPRRRKRRPQAAPPTSESATSGTAARANAASENPASETATSASTASESPGSPGAENASAATDADAKARLRKRRRWPSKYRAIADFIGDDAAAIAARLRALLADPEAVAYIRANPAFARLLRPLCRGFRVPLIPELRRKPAFRFDEDMEPLESIEPIESLEPIDETPHAEPAPEPVPELVHEPVTAAEPPPTPQASPVLPPQPPMYGIGPPDWTPTDPGPSMKERVDRWLARQRAMGLI